MTTNWYIAPHDRINGTQIVKTAEEEGDCWIHHHQKGDGCNSQCIYITKDPVERGHRSTL